MIEKTITIYVFIDDLLIKLNHKEPPNRNMSDAEVITTVLVSAIYFSGHHEKAMSFMKSTGMIPYMLSKSRFNRRLHQLRNLIVDLFFQLSGLIKELNISSEYTIHSFPVHTCDNIRLTNSKLSRAKFIGAKKLPCEDISMATTYIFSQQLTEYLWNTPSYLEAIMTQML
jgi:hypothetical protein